MPVPVALAALLYACAHEPQPPAGETVFATHCASCHGRRGEGDGPEAARLETPVPNLRTLNRRNGGRFPADAVAATIDGRNLPAAHVRGEMPVWGDVFDATARIVEGAEPAQARVDVLVEYLRELQSP